MNTDAKDESFVAVMKSLISDSKMMCVLMNVSTVNFCLCKKEL